MEHRLIMIIILASFLLIISNTLIFLRKDQNRTEQSQLLKKLILCDFRSARFSLLPGLKGSLTVEAALILPLLIFIMYLLIFPLRVMEAERRLQNDMESVGKNLAVTKYIENIGEDILLKNSKYEEFMSGAVNGLEEGLSLGSILANAGEGPFRDIRFSDDTAVFSEEEGADSSMFYARLIYDVDMPSLSFVLPPIEKSLVVNRRAWVGSSGGRGRSKYAEDIVMEHEEEEDRIVYLGKTSTVYHDDPNCHYLSNSLSSADLSAMEEKRNKYGGKYHACPSCKPRSGTVYYFESGTAYHSSDRCKAITAYARAVHLSECKGMRACSYCGKS